MSLRSGYAPMSMREAGDANADGQWVDSYLRVGEAKTLVHLRGRSSTGR